MPLVRSLTLPTMRRRRRSARPQALSCRSPVPVLAAGGSFGWALEIEIEFTQPRLGVSLREVSADAMLGAFAAEVDALPKPSRSKRAGAAELYNWSVPPEKRLVVGMRLTGINEVSLAGYSYAQVVKELKRTKRPVRLRFADVTRSFDTDDASESESDDDSAGTVETLEDASADELHGDKLQRMVDHRADALARVLVTNEIVAERGELDRRELTKALALVSAKSLVLSHAVDELHADQRALQDTRSVLARDQRRLERVLTELRALEAPGAVNPEKERARRLEERHQLLTRDIERLKQGNERMRKERSEWRRQLDELEQQLAEVQPEAEKEAEKAKQQVEDDEDVQPEDEWMADASLAELRAQTKALEEEMEKEQRKLAKARHERDQLRKYDLMQRAMEEEMERRHRKLSYGHYERNQQFYLDKRHHAHENDKERKLSNGRHDRDHRQSKPHHDMENGKVRKPSNARPELDQQRRLSKPHHSSQNDKERRPSNGRNERDQQRRPSKPQQTKENEKERPIPNSRAPRRNSKPQQQPQETREVML